MVTLGGFFYLSMIFIFSTLLLSLLQFYLGMPTSIKSFSADRYCIAVW